MIYDIYIYYIIYIHIRFPYFHCYPASSPLHKLLPVSGASSPQLFGSTVTKRCWAETEIAVVAGRWSGYIYIYVYILYIYVSMLYI